MEYEHKTKEKNNEWKRKALGSIAIILVFIIPLFLLYYKHYEKIDYLQQLELEIDAAIESGNYDIALLKANKLHCDDNWSSEETAVWDAKREAYITIIEEKQRQQDIQDPNMIFMYAPSKNLKGKKYTDVVEQLQSLGFTNVSSQVASESAGFFKKADTVEHILVGGVTEFTTDDYFDKDTRIVVYYYSK